MVSQERTLDVDSMLKASTTDAMIVKASINPPELKVCALLHKLPREVRDKIWRLILLRPVAIVPRVRIKQYLFTAGGQTGGHKHCRFQRKYSYIWAQAPIPDPFRGNTIRREIAWTTNPTRKEFELIQSGVSKFMIDDSPEPGQQTECAVYHRDGFGPQIINKAEIQIHPFGRCVAITRVCKQMEQECTKILYGENTYEFDLSSCHRMYRLKTPWDVPGFPLFEESPSKATISTAVEKLFDLECYQPAFVAKDPFIRFMAYIGRKNASLLRDIKFVGEFIDILPTHKRNLHLGFGAILPTYTLIIAEVCPRLRKLTLHQYLYASSHYRDLEKDVETGYDFGMMDIIIGKLVFDLPNLRQLQLGDYSKPQNAHSPHNHSFEYDSHKYEWVKSIRWMKFVDERWISQLCTPCTIPTDLPNNDVRQTHVAVRSGAYSRYKDSLEHERSGSYGTSTCTWTVTRCPTQHNPDSVERSPRVGHHQKDRYGFLPQMSDDVWKCSDAHGGIRRRKGQILNISAKVDQDSAPRTWVPGQRVKKWWH
ncbi:predicted protein [Botrytis cinerea T4]|uniref:Uncharacterized protein n=1 Tax=Botryotinia fuckeliana (strain T4) TaxID=999810 RepID=G2Y6Q5_BOTF4|nr:predicted protein [Botrytis cinerea T4]